MAALRRYSLWSAGDLAAELFKSRSSVAALSSVRRALLKLEKAGLIVSAPAAGTARFWQLSEAELKRQKRKPRKNWWDAFRDRQKRNLDREERKRSREMAPILRLAKTLGLLGSDHDGEALSAARAAERQRKDLDLSWAALLGLQE